MRKIYLLGGLGADERIFQKLKLNDFEYKYLKWISPDPNEQINDYARRLIEQIEESNPTLLGVSFGGIMINEISKIIPTDKLIMISSARTKFDIPWIYRVLGFFHLNRIIPAQIFKKINWLTFWFFGAKDNEDKEILKTIIQDTDPYFLSWSIDKIITWRNEVNPVNSILIHGTNDRILPIKKPEHVIRRAGHLMVYNRADEISGIINRILSEDSAKAQL